MEMHRHRCWYYSTRVLVMNKLHLSDQPGRGVVSLTTEGMSVQTGSISGIYTYVSKPPVPVVFELPPRTFSRLPTRRINSAMISSSLATFVFATRLMFSMTVFCDRIAVKERRCLSVKVIVDTPLPNADLLP
jgi:hypothetical protein